MSIQISLRQRSHTIVRINIPLCFPTEKDLKILIATLPVVICVKKKKV